MEPRVVCGVTLTKPVLLQRTCATCGPYDFHGVCQASGFSEEGNTGAWADAAAKIRKGKKQLDSRHGRATFGVICPRCGQIIASAREQYFYDGVRYGVLRMAWNRVIFSSLIALVFIGVTVLLCLQYAADTSAERDNWLIPVAILVVPGLVTVVIVAEWCRVSMVVAWVLVRLNDEQVEYIGLTACRRNSGTLYTHCFFPYATPPAVPSSGRSLFDGNYLGCFIAEGKGLLKQGRPLESLKTTSTRRALPARPLPRPAGRQSAAWFDELVDDLPTPQPGCWKCGSRRLKEGQTYCPDCGEYVRGGPSPERPWQE